MGRREEMKYDLTILCNLMKRPMYGYELKKVIERTLVTCDTTGTGFSSSMIYPSLAQFEQQGYIKKEVQLQAGKPNRNTYEMTEAGRQFFYDFVNDITSKTVHDRELFYYRLTCFEYLTERSRKKLLSGRRKYLEEGLFYLQGEEEDGKDPCREDLREFTRALAELELRHIAFFEDHIAAPCVVPIEARNRIDAVS